MTNIENIPLQDNYDTTTTGRLAKDAAELTIQVKEAPKYLPTSTPCRAIINPGKTNAELVIIEDYDASTLTLTVKAAGRAQPLYKGDTGSLQEHASGSQIIISDNYAFWQEISDSVNSKADQLGLPNDVYANAAARSAAIPTPSNGMQSYLTDTGLAYDYLAGEWIERSSGGTFPNASETVAGKVEIATTAEALAGSDTGTTGAKIVMTPANGVFTDTAVAAAGYIPKTKASGAIDKELIEVLKDTGATVTAANLDTLTDGSVADALHSHTGLGVVTATAGESIDGSSTPKAVFIGGDEEDSTIDAEFSQLVQNSTFDIDSATARILQGFKFSKVGTLTEIVLKAGVFGSPSDLIADLYLDNGSGEPTGGSLANATGSESGGNVTFTFSYAITDQLTSYVLVVKGGATADGSNYYSIMYQDTDVYSDGAGKTSSDSGSTWSVDIGDLYFEVTGEIKTQGGLMYLSDSSNYITNRFDGFSESDKASGENATMKSSGQIDGFTGLTDGATYNVGTNGAITTGGTGIQIGVAISTTSIYIGASQSVSLNIGHGVYAGTSATGSISIPHNLGAVPTSLRLRFDVDNDGASREFPHHATGYWDGTDEACSWIGTEAVSTTNTPVSGTDVRLATVHFWDSGTNSFDRIWVTVSSVTSTHVNLSMSCDDSYATGNVYSMFVDVYK